MPARAFACSSVGGGSHPGIVDARCGAAATRYAIRPGIGSLPEGTRRLLDVLARLFPIHICDVGAGAGAHGELVFAGSEELCTPSARDRTPAAARLTLPDAAAGSASPRGQSVQVRFAHDAEVPAPFRGRVVQTTVNEELAPLRPQPHEKVLASCGAHVIWVAERATPVPRYRSALALPALGSGHGFCDAFSGERFLEMLPLLHFLRRTATDGAYSLPVLRASFMLDDPNLHWPRYGCVDYRAIVQHACRHQYHVSIATIPLDAWYTHARTAELFRRNPGQLSLAIHGNNHAKRELAARCEPERRRALLQQALSRVERLERAAGVRVCRVMVPPHGACSAATLATLPGVGYEAACLSAGSLRAFNPDRPWAATVGFRPAERVEGCTVLPRWSLTAGSTNAILVAAYLGQPMILRAHQQDLQCGLELLDEAARSINALGDVLWSNVTDLSRRSYFARLDGTVWRVVPCAGTVMVTPPAAATQIEIHEPTADAQERWHAVFVAGRRVPMDEGRLPIRIEDAGRSVVLARTQVREPSAAGRPWTSPRLLLRRALTEARDRLSGIQKRGEEWRSKQGRSP